MRIVLLTLTLVFIAGLGALTGYDLAHNGLTVLDVFAFAVLVLFAIGIVGALRHPPRE